MRTTHPRFLERIRAYLAPHRATEAEALKQGMFLHSAIISEDRKISERKVLRGISSLYLQALRVYHGRDEEEMAGTLLYSMRALALGYLDEFIRFRAGAVSLDGGALLLPSQPHRQLAALVGKLVEKGAEYLGDESAKLDPILSNVHPLSLPLLIDVGDVRLFPRVERRRKPRRVQAWMRYPVPPEELGGRRADPAPLRWVSFLSFEPGEETRLEPTGGSEAVFWMSQTCTNLDIWGDRGMLYFRDLLDDVAVSRLVVGSIDEAADLLLEAAPRIMGGGEE